MCMFCGWEEAQEEAEEILSRLDGLPEVAEDFADSARETVEGIQEWIEDNGHVTDRQKDALDNVSAAIDRWEAHG